MPCGVCGRDDQLRKASVVWETGTSDGDGTIGLVGVLGGLTHASGRVADDLDLAERGTFLGASASTGRLHVHEVTIAARKCAPPELARAAQPIKGLVSIVGLLAGLVTFLLLLSALAALGYDLGFHHFKGWRAFDRVETRTVLKNALIFTAMFLLAGWAIAALATLRKGERSRFETEYSIWSNTYYCLRDGWLGVP